MKFKIKDTSDLDRLVEMLAVTRFDIITLLELNGACSFHRGISRMFEGIEPFQVAMGIPFVDEEGYVQTEILNHVVHIDVDCTNDSAQLIVYYFDGMPQRKEYFYEGIHRNLICNVRFLVDVTNVLRDSNEPFCLV